MQPLSFLRQIANFSPGRDMIFQNFGQGVSNLSTVAELRMFDGIVSYCLCCVGVQLSPSMLNVLNFVRLQKPIKSEHFNQDKNFKKYHSFYGLFSDIFAVFRAVFPNFTMNDTTELMDNWDNFEEPILEIDFEENVVADQGRPHSHSSLFLLNPH
jgi:hypothetical protein